ncbi:autoinducer synthase [Halovulum dunhuangense]|uniref:Acyl-homoserine-lactone synthase n=1 Tax=Halovulum dunhuangense TaxID=1505036 RepID=A0A849KTQ9_9RHOB|nr:acyl-homoserine-lactone synthase [Halovulum dunhuangense]NNU78911.1 autoinducer synthase [Halovulum dunhuangense]
MIRFLYASQLALHPELARTMFRDRTAQFITRLGWDLNADSEGGERDAYDAMNPLYVILEDGAGRHAASMRVMPTLGRTMVNDHFSHLNNGIQIRAPFVWECTRFCLAPGNPTESRNRAGLLMLAGQELGLRLGLTRALGVYEAHMARIYRGIGWEPSQIGAEGEGRGRICLGIWPFGPDIRDRIAERAGLSPDIVAPWFDAAFPSGVAAIAA